MWSAEVNQPADTEDVNKPYFYIILTIKILILFEYVAS